MAALIATLTFAAPAGAEVTPVRKEDNTDGLDQVTSWVGGAAVPGIADIAQWDNQLSGANTSDLGATSSSWLGIKVLNPPGAVGITGTSPSTLTLGASGIDLSAATQNLTIGAPLVLGGAQPWSVASGRTVTINTPNTTANDVTPWCVPAGNPPCTNTGSGNAHKAARSKHPGGVNTLFGDGSIRFVRNSIPPTTWRAYGTMNGGEVVSNE